jgi:ABC-2 type transport system ATP-binding protein
MTAAHVHLAAVSMRFGDQHALHAVDLLEQGGVTTVLGANGAGKSTLLRCLATVLRPSGGTIRIDGLDVEHESERIEARRRLGYAPQDAGFDHRVRVHDALDFVAVLKGITDNRARRRAVFAALRAVGLDDRARGRIGDLSGGMRRRLVTAQALLGSPSLLVLDEPGAGLDPDERIRLRELLAELRSAATVIMSTHLVDDAADADTVVVLGDGAVRFVGTPEQLAARAAGRAWLQEGFPPPGVRASWLQLDGRHRCLGTPPPGAGIVDPTLEDGFLLVRDE